MERRDEDWPEGFPTRITLRDDTKHQSVWSTHLLDIHPHISLRLESHSAARKSEENKQTIPRYSFCIIRSHFCSVQSGFNFIFGKSLTHTAAKLAVGTNVMCLIVGSASKETQWAQTACRSLCGPGTQRTQEVTLAKGKVDTFTARSQRETILWYFEHISAHQYTHCILNIYWVFSPPPHAIGEAVMQESMSQLNATAVQWSSSACESGRQMLKQIKCCSLWIELSKLDDILHSLNQHSGFIMQSCE